MRATAPPGPVNLDLLSILAVEDGAFMRSLVAGVLRTLGVGRVHAVNDGAAAIRFIDERRGVLPPGTAPVDLVITDLVMPEVDGLMLLRWIRFSPRSPDRFLPVLMLSGLADRHYVRQARDLGATDFIAKPFSPKTVGDRLLHALARPRRFVLANGYFGPDRRRIVKPVQMECRMTGADEILVVHSRSKATGIDRYPVVHFDLPNRLGAKAGIGPKGPLPSFSEEVLAAAVAEIESRAGDYATWIAGEVEVMARTVELIGEAAATGEPIGTLAAEVNRASHEMRGQGGIFGYPLVTLIAKSLYEATLATGTTVTPNEHLLMRAHVDAVRAVMNGRISGDGGTTGQQLLASLERAKKKYARAPERADS